MSTWRRLPREQRRAVMAYAKAGQVVPDAAVARIAREWAASRQRRRRWAIAAAGLIDVVAVAAVALDQRLLAGIGGGLALVTALVAIVGWTRQLTVMAAEIQSRANVAADHREALIVHRNRRPRRTLLGPAAAGVIVLVAMGCTSFLDEGDPPILLSILLLLIVVPGIVIPPAGSVLAILDADGLRVPHLGFAAPWSALRTATVIGAAGRLEIEWRSAEIGLMRRYSTLSAWRRWLADHGLARSDSVHLPVAWLAESPETILRASWNASAATHDRA